MKHALLTVLLLGSLASAQGSKGPITIGSKIDTEGALLCQITKQLLEANDFKVNDRCSTGPTAVVRRALLQGEIDMYPEYTGTALFLLGEQGQKIDPNVSRSAARAYSTAKQLDLKVNRVVWLGRAPANNTWAIAVTKSVADKNKLRTMADLAKYVNGGGVIKLAASQEFVDRDDALKAFEKTYGFALKPEQLVIVPGGNTTQTQQAAAQGTSGVNAAMAYGTDGSIAALGLVSLSDPKGAVAVYEPAITMRQQVAQRFPEIARIVNPVFARLTAPTLQTLNGRIAVGGESPANVARDFLKRGGFVK
ncbi:ABC transporter substrate-binding protein [Deinococcus yavapaiensis]|uniref:Osmoprotectant transport system substrate-binding protein n=1 Tax=Deinococcus yavapaiensis KR-236 TaxID=694435 RepID=A0A318S432_9DEIO|nr:ABC transporter substrate-binding protein [Deinococcus yavapaiensis]PYE51129.1 osmoprotectant transport system substrate-binding protein [Deinococcus yavapaiensis KR-236]